MSIDWMTIPSQYNYAHRAAHHPKCVSFTNVPMLEKDGRLFYPENEMVSCYASWKHTFPEGVLQIERPRMSEPVWDVLPEELTCLRIYSDDTILGNESCCSHEQFELILRMNLGAAIYKRPDAVPEPVGGTCIAMATEVMLKQRAKGIEKYNSTIEAQDGYDVMGMLRMAQEEMADGAVYLAKLKMMMDRLRDHAVRGDIDAIKRELGL